MAKFRQWKDEFGRKSYGYHHRKHGHNDNHETVIQIERALVRKCERKGIDFSDARNCKLDLIRRLFGMKVYREYARAIMSQKNIDFQKGY